MMDECRARAVVVFGAQFEAISATYEGQRTDGTHAVNASVNVRGPETFQCSFGRDGYRIERFIVNTPTSGPRANGTPTNMVDACRARAAAVFGTTSAAVEASYQGERTDGTHAVNGSVNVRGPETFQCSYARGGKRIEQFIVNFPRND